MKLFFAAVCGLLVLNILGCSPKNNVKNQVTDAVDEKVIYGSDDRVDYFEVNSPEWLDRADSTVALINSSKITANANGFSIRTSNYGTSNGLCKNEPFYNQGTAAFCSGSLVAPDLVMTAGHCIMNSKTCQSTRFVFNFAYKTADDNPSQVDADDMYSCRELVYSETKNSNNSDLAIVRLDRPVVGRKPLPVRRSGRIANATPLVVIGYPKGLPLKLADGASVRNNQHRIYFVANLDTYGGNSGSPVFNQKTGLIEGILVRGEQDMVYKNGCYTSNVCTDAGCRGEDVTRVSEVLKHVQF